MPPNAQTPFGIALASVALLLCAMAPVAEAALEARGSIKQAYVLGAKKGQRLLSNGG